MATTPTFDALELHDQFLLSPGEAALAPLGWRVRGLGAWELATHPSLPVVELRLGDGALVGLLLGHAVNAEGVLLRGLAVLEGSYDSLSGDDLERWLYRLGGRFACFVNSPRLARFYLDPLGSLAAVYDPRRPVIASTGTALRWGKGFDFGPALGPNRFHPAGLTADPEARRLLPNHYLDLALRRPVRHWPSRATNRVDDLDVEAVDALVRRIVERMQLTAAGLARAYPCYIGLTAGRDSRMVLAAVKAAVPRACFVTFAYQDQARANDLHVARAICHLLGLEHQTLSLESPPEEERRRYLLRIGNDGHWAKAGTFHLACADSSRCPGPGSPASAARSAGPTTGAEDESRPALTPTDPLGRLSLPLETRACQAMEGWAAGAPEGDVFELLDWLYVEQRMGCWAGPHMYGTAPFVANLTPFSHRDVVSAMMALPRAFRRQQGLTDWLVARALPQLRDVPYQHL